VRSQSGFNELVPQQLLKSFDERELELVIGGLGKIDLEDWRTNTRLKHCQTDTPQVAGIILYRVGYITLSFSLSVVPFCLPCIRSRYGTVPNYQELFYL
jgi:hypothetical protein